MLTSKARNIKVLVFYNSIVIFIKKGFIFGFNRNNWIKV